MSHVDGVDDGVGYGVSGKSNRSSGVVGQSQGSAGMLGLSNNGDGVHGGSDYGHGLVGISAYGVGLYSESVRNDYAAILDGKVKITGNLEKAGGSFKIDHPLDPANK
jgi:hypothetical protein